MKALPQTIPTAPVPLLPELQKHGPEEPCLGTLRPETAFALPQSSDVAGWELVALTL